LIPRPRYQLLAANGAELMRIDAPAGRLAAPDRWPDRALEAAPSHGARGEEEAPGAFEEPFGPRFYQGFSAHLGIEATRDKTPLEVSPLPRVLTWGGGGLALVGVAGVVWSGIDVKTNNDRYNSTGSDSVKKDAEQKALSAQQRAVGFGVAAGAFALTAALGYFLDR
jgi:hypothetical protein